MITVKRLIKEPPIQTTSTKVEGIRAVLLRVGEPAPKTEREIANQMKADFARLVGRPLPANDYGCLKGLAQRWPDGMQVQIFRTVVREWASFKALVSMKIDEMLDQGVPGAKQAYHKWPSVSVMLRFHEAAVEFHIAQLQWELTAE